jgi:hypothetical protein
VAHEGCHGSLLSYEIFINEPETEVNIVLIKSTVDTNLDGTVRQGEREGGHRWHTNSLRAFKDVE